jgi:hypothetical protein
MPDIYHNQHSYQFVLALNYPSTSSLTVTHFHPFVVVAVKPIVWSVVASNFQLFTSIIN